MRQKVWRFLSSKTLMVFLAVQTASCGTLLHPERSGQPAGQLDPGIVVLDAVGLVLFFVPGVIAFAVDFSNGTIYLPPSRTSAVAVPENQRLQTLQIAPGELTSERLEQILRERTGQSVRLEPGTYRATRIHEIEDFTSTALNDLEHSNIAANVTFRGTAK
jgi:hypothetical protein